MTKPCRVIFMGTPDFSVPALKRLAREKGFLIPLVVTQPDRPKGRGKKRMPSPVKEAALELGLDIFQPEKLNTPEAENKLRHLKPDFFVVAAFGQILSQNILDIPKIFPVNIHASLLPKYRGAAPIQAAIQNMDETTGITTMVMAKKMDAGDILLTSTTPIREDETAQDLHDRLGQMGADLIVKTLHMILEDRLQPCPQDHTRATYVKMLKKEDGRIDWSLENREIRAHINAMTPWPGAFTRLDGQPLKIFKAVPAEITVSNDPGTVFKCDKDGIHVATGKGALTILELMGASGKRLKAHEFLNGHKITPPVKFDR